MPWALMRVYYWLNPKCNLYGLDDLDHPESTLHLVRWVLIMVRGGVASENGGPYTRRGGPFIPALLIYDLESLSLPVPRPLAIHAPSHSAFHDGPQPAKKHPCPPAHNQP